MLNTAACSRCICVNNNTMNFFTNRNLMQKHNFTKMFSLIELIENLIILNLNLNRFSFKPEEFVLLLNRL